MALSWAQNALTVASGGAVGFSLGLIGGGGSILAVPLLLYVVGIADAHVAIGTSALAVGGFFGMRAAVHLAENRRMLTSIFAAVIFVVAIYMLIRTGLPLWHAMFTKTSA